MTQPRLPLEPPSEPTWDGRGVDPWLPKRLAAQTAIVVGERTIYDDYFARLSRWLAETYRVLRAGVVPDPIVIYSKIPAWVESMGEFVHDSIAKQVGAAYRGLFGEGYRFDQRPFVAQYLAQAQNRLIEVPEQVYTAVVGQIAEGAGMGESIPKIRDRIRTVFDTTSTPHWQNRAAVVARTETLGARNAGRQDAFQAFADEFDDEQFEHAWLSTLDSRTRPAHRAADGQRVPVGTPYIVGGYPMMRPGDPMAPADLTIQCRCTELLLRPGEDVDLSNRQMVGP